MQLTLNLEISPPPVKLVIPNNPWIDVSSEASLIGFTQRVEISQSLHDRLQPLQPEDEDAYNQRLYDVVWLAYHYHFLDQRPSYSFTLDFLRQDVTPGKFIEASLRVHVEILKETARLGFLKDFQNDSIPIHSTTK